MKAWILAVTAAITLAGCSTPQQPQHPPQAHQQQPFICRTVESGLGQPLPDNDKGIGHPVRDDAGKLVGYSSQCAIKPRIQLFYFTGTGFKPFDPESGYKLPPPDMKMTLVNGATIPFVVRVEVGTINRFVYTIAMLELAPWNHKLVYWMRGGVGIGHQQGLAMWFNDALNGSEKLLMPKLLAEGYAIASSSGNESGVHYNMRLAEETAAQTKAYFTATYGKPVYTIGIGGSGGAVQQYMFAQNRPGLFDAGIPVQSYPDMITQSIPIADCPLLGQYFREEVERDPASPWATWSRQSLVQGMNASDTAKNPITGKTGSTECINGWRFAMPTTLNPYFRDSKFDKAIAFYGYAPEIFAKVKWTHWNDLEDIYGTDAEGYAPIPIDNVGVQYGLSALAAGKLDADEFLRLNACAGSWKEQREFVPYKPDSDPFDSANMHRSATCRDPAGTPAPRREGEQRAIRAAWDSGHVFSGKQLGIPMIDLRPYREAELDMHNARQAFSVRARLLAANPGEAKRQVIWFARPDTDLPGQVMKALWVLDKYLSSGSAPPEFADRCVDSAGTVIGSGPEVWAGVLDGGKPGACTLAFPIHSSPRMVAGESIRGDTFKCRLKPVSAAIADGTYGPSVRFSDAQKAWLARIFPQGVCDYNNGL
ncbi:DUF6351 family protein [Pseudoduganella violaceinigra]|uniref:DUF6351 family protein n=1 Tax=Pseudoduganella violaceinigra TaxID=246602 RepID=UPI0012B5C8E3|nr:DUF6351 family protein [Pseudoduganella violaceinigra]